MDSDGRYKIQCDNTGDTPLDISTNSVTLSKPLSVPQIILGTNPPITDWPAGYASTDSYTKAESDGKYATTNDVTTLQGQMTTTTGEVATLKAATSSWNTASTDASAATNDSVALKAATNALEARVSALEVPYQPYSATVSPDAGGTCTITYAQGSLAKIYMPATNITLTFDSAAFPTSGVSRVGVEIYSPTNSIAYVYATIESNSALTLSTNGWTSLFFRRAGNEVWKGRK